MMSKIQVLIDEREREERTRQRVEGKTVEESLRQEAIKQALELPPGKELSPGEQSRLLPFVGGIPLSNLRGLFTTVAGLIDEAVVRDREKGRG
jgi:hypothetical protein